MAKGFGDGDLSFAADGYELGSRGLLRGCTGEGEKYGGVFTELDALICALRSLPCGVTIETLFRRLADRIPGAMQTGLVPGQVTAEEAAVTIALKHRLARVTADPVISRWREIRTP